MGDSDDSHDDLTPPEHAPIMHRANIEPCRVLADYSMRLLERRRALDNLRLSIAMDSRRVGDEGWHRIADDIRDDGVDAIVTQGKLREAAAVK